VRPGDNGLPIVYHPAYSKPVMPAGHRFPMPVFATIYHRWGWHFAAQQHTPQGRGTTAGGWVGRVRSSLLTLS
jgi:hypothetical protein